MVLVVSDCEDRTGSAVSSKNTNWLRKPTDEVLGTHRLEPVWLSDLSHSGSESEPQSDESNRSGC